jgi:hypothetical protein
MPSQGALLKEVRRFLRLEVRDIICVRCYSNKRFMLDCPYCGGNGLLQIDAIRHEWLDLEFRIAFMYGVQPIWMRSGFYVFYVENELRYWIVDSSTIIPIPKEVVREAVETRRLGLSRYARGFLDWIFLTVSMVRGTDTGYRRTSSAEVIRAT